MRVYLSDTFRALGLRFDAPADGDAGYDLYAMTRAEIAPGQVVRIPTGVHLEIPQGYVGLVKDRSSMGLRGLHMLGGVIDSSYRGEVQILMLNTGALPYVVAAGHKVAQMVVLPVYTRAVIPVEALDALSETLRGADGFGSTGE